MDCARAGLSSWPGNGWKHPSTPLLHCPNAANVSLFKAAMGRGDIFQHAFPLDAEASYYPDASLFEAGLTLAADVAEAVGAPPPNSVSQRDVPGWTRAAIPLLNKHGVIGLSFGAGTPPGKPDIPPMFVWRHEQSGTEVVTTWETAYGSINTLFVLPNGVALAVQWEGDNTGPGPIEQVQSFYTTLRTKYPHATVNVSTFDAFFAVANQPEVKSQLPVVTKEIGDGWIYGVPSDPLKNAMFREVARQRSACIASGECDLGSPDMKAFDRLLVKIPEHTW